jgi:murein DD-endopeptidase MepM/ murein hydrolase activator NlpD
VVFAGIKGGYGRVVILDHGYGYRTVYGHNSKLNVKTGQTVERGDIIAYVGSSGRSTGPHVHYEVLYQGRNKNPSEYMP